jgi:hypothetical protein
MLRIRQLLLPLLVAALLPVLPGKAAAVPVAFEREILLELPLRDARVLRLAILDDRRPLARVRLFTVEITLLPSGRLIARTVLALPHRHAYLPAPGPEPVILPLPGALPMFLGALLGLAVIARRRRRTDPLAGTAAAP